jgi:hypothetical protein
MGEFWFQTRLAVWQAVSASTPTIPQFLVLISSLGDLGASAVNILERQARLV